MGSPGSRTPHHPAALSQAWTAAAAPPTQSPSCPSPFTGVSPALWSEGPPHIPTSCHPHTGVFSTCLLHVLFCPGICLSGTQTGTVTSYSQQLSQDKSLFNICLYLYSEAVKRRGKCSFEGKKMISGYLSIASLPPKKNLIEGFGCREIISPGDCRKQE